MIKVPEALQKKYNRLLMNSEIAPDQYSYCKKWLRYYLDFCRKSGAFPAIASKKTIQRIIQELKT